MVAELDDALLAHGQCVAIPPTGTVGGALAVGRSGIRRLGYGPVRDAAAAGALRVGGRRGRQGRRPDGEERQRVRPVPAARRVAGHARVPRRRDPAHPAAGPLRAVVQRRRSIRSRRWRRLYRPTSVLWDGTTTWVLLEGDERDVEAQVGAARRCEPADEPPPLPTGGRWSLPPGELRRLTRHVRRRGRRRHRPPRRAAAAAAASIRPSPSCTGGSRSGFDPTGRLNPGVDVARCG